MKIFELRLNQKEIAAIEEICVYIESEGFDSNENQFLSSGLHLQSQLPSRILSSLDTLLGAACTVGVSIRSLPETTMPSPRTHYERRNRRLNRMECITGLCALHLGEIYGYTSQQDGRIFNDIIPLDDYKEVSDCSGGYLSEFRLHTEDSFFAFPPDFIIWGCHRNQERAVTKLAAIDDADVSPEVQSLLMMKEYCITPNAFQNTKVFPTSYQILTPVGDGVTNMRMNAHTAFSESAKEQFRDAYGQLVSALEEKAVERIFAPGEIFVLNNRRVAHGRVAYEASNHEGRRWLTRLIVRRDLEAAHQFMYKGCRNILDPSKKTS
ncbi:MAG TPA: TauD/TfdA family dioxygenase [Chthoniobacterales bacterium]|nr:TauD/TfdA family dioxygenase [Chthoniobacterales bacterium]